MFWNIQCSQNPNWRILHQRYVWRVLQKEICTCFFLKGVIEGKLAAPASHLSNVKLNTGTVRSGLYLKLALSWFSFTHSRVNVWKRNLYYACNNDMFTRDHSIPFIKYWNLLLDTLEIFLLHHLSNDCEHSAKR